MASAPEVELFDVAASSKAEGVVRQDGPVFSEPASLRVEAAWLVLRPLSKASNRVLEAVRLGVWGPNGMTPVNFQNELESGVVVVPTAPEIGLGRICLVADGHMPIEVTELVRQGGIHDCILDVASRFEVVLEDLARTPASGLELGLECQLTQREERLKVWPTEVAGGVFRFDLARGVYSIWIGDDSIAVWSGGEPVVVDDFTPRKRTVALVGLLACALRFPRSEVRVFSIEEYPSDLIAIHEEQIIGAAKRLRMRLDSGIFVRFAATRSLAKRTLLHDVKARMNPGDGESRLHVIAFQPIDRVVPQEIHIDLSPSSGQIRVRLVRPAGQDLNGADIQIFQRRGDRSGQLVAVVKSGDEWSSMAAGRYFARPRLPSECLENTGPIEVDVAPGGSTEIDIRLAKDLIAADLRIELEGGGLPPAATVRVRGDGLNAVYSSRKPERVRVWVAPTKTAVEVFVTDQAHRTDTADVAVEVDFAISNLHTITIPSR